MEGNAHADCVISMCFLGDLCCRRTYPRMVAARGRCFLRMGEGKKAYKWNWADGNVDVGHAFWEMRCRPVPTAVLDIAESPFLNTRVGFYGDGFHVPDNTHQPEVVKMLPISKAKFLSGLRFCEGFRASTPEYNLSDYNCCNATIDAAAACGISINRETQSWMFGGGLNPTSLGNDLMANNWQYIK